MTCSLKNDAYYYLIEANHLAPSGARAFTGKVMTKFRSHIYLTDATGFWATFSPQSLGALVCMSRRDIPVCPGDVIICRRWCAELGFGLFATHSLPHDVTFSINRWCQVPPCGENWSMHTSRSSGQNALRTWPWSFLLIMRCCFILCKEWISSNSFLCIYNKNCDQANGNNRHLVPDAPIGLGRDIRDMPIACARTHPNADKHTRHIPMYRPVHSAHANKCSLCLSELICWQCPSIYQVSLMKLTWWPCKYSFIWARQ